MEATKVVGIDPSSGDYQCALIRQGEKKVIHKPLPYSNLAINCLTPDN